MPHTQKVFCCIMLAFVSTLCTAQYTETINSNRPGESQGSFSVGNGVLQAETGFDFGNATHELLNTDTNIFGYNLALRYGLFFEELEINTFLRYQAEQVSFTTGAAGNTVQNGLENFQIGAKYLVYDPYKNAKEEINLYSYHANNRFKWKTLIPAVSVYLGGAFDFTERNNTSFSPGSSGVREDGVSPIAAIITQNNWGRWVWVNNFIYDRIGSNFPSKIWITTLTHSINPRFATFGEFQFISGDLYSDQLIRGGFAYLFTKDFQVDIGGLVNFKNTPSRWNVSAGISYRLDMHKKDKVIQESDDKKSSGSKKQAERINKKKKKRRDSVEPDGDGTN